jgi:hypothetical protein
VNVNNFLAPFVFYSRYLRYLHGQAYTNCHDLYMSTSKQHSLDELLDLVHQDGLIDDYEASGSRVTFHQGGETFSLQTESARDFLSRVVRAMGLDSEPAAEPV